MGPRGMLVYEMVLRHGAREGEMHMRGVHFQMLPGMNRHRIAYTLRKTG